MNSATERAGTDGLTSMMFGMRVTPATGAYGHAMANNYNGIPRPPVIFCAQGDARVVVRRESFEDLTARDVIPEGIARDGG